jgi:Transmembrane family, TMEM144 of transporters
VIWGSFNMLTGWASGRFGWFGLHKQPVSHPGLNTAGVCVAVLALIMFMFVKPEEQQYAKAKREDEEGLLDPVNDRYRADPYLPQSFAYREEGYDVKPQAPAAASSGGSFVDGWSASQKRLFGVVMSLVSGVFYGTNFDPPQYILDHRHSKTFELDGVIPAPNNLVDYAFPHFCGIFIASTVYFLIYCAFKRNKPVVYPEICLPGFISGVLWALAEVGWFVANDNLEFPVAFPLVAVGPGLIGSLWGVFVFGEIRGKRNYAVLVLAFATSIGSSAMIALSK